MSRRNVAFALALLLWPAAGFANDSTAFQATTGIELTTTPDIRMVSEELFVSPAEIRVAYVFRNVGAKPVETLVAFPFPDLDLRPGLTASNWQFPVDQPNFLGFKVWIDDRPVTPTLERRAFVDGKEVTRELEQTGALDVLAPWARGGYDAQVNKLPAGAIERLRAAGLVKEGDDSDNPQWTLRSRYYWRQTFPPGVDVRVRHIYKPFVGGALTDRPSTIDGRRVVGRYLGSESTPTGDRYCIDAATRRALAKLEQHPPGEVWDYGATELDYILTTARNWRGPIGRFHLTIDKGDPKGILSLCWSGLKKTGPTMFESILTDFVPDRDIRLVIFGANKRPQ